MKPPFAYYGGKTNLASVIAGLLPEHTHYVEPFAGSLAVLLAKPPSKMETVNDLDGDVMAFWRTLRDRPDDLARVCSLTPHSRAELAAARRDDDQPDELEQARRVWVMLSQARTGTTRRSTGWRHHGDAANSGASMPQYLDAYVDRMLPAAARIRHVSLECRPADELITAYGKHPGVLLYLDPPYMGDTRAVNYGHEMHHPDEHAALLHQALDCRAAVVISGYAHPLYEERLTGWDRHEMTAGTAQGGTYSTRTEVLWSNRPLNHGRLEGIA